MLITEGYLAILKQMTDENSQWGNSGYRHAPGVLTLAEGCHAPDILDYGCGTGSLGEALKDSRINVWNYDPVHEPLGRRVCKVVACIDVMEHVEPDCIEDVMDDIATLGLHSYYVISLRKAYAVLPDGRNAHISLMDADRWLERMRARYDSLDVVESKDDELVTMCYDSKTWGDAS